jgi:hypothetical protein
MLLAISSRQSSTAKCPVSSLCISAFGRWGRKWYYIGMCGTIALIALYAATKGVNPLITSGINIPINDIPTEMFLLKLNHISPCISPEENAKNRAQNEQLRRSGDIGDVCSQHIIVITVTITQFFRILVANILFLQLFGFRIFPICIVVRTML